MQVKSKEQKDQKSKMKIGFKVRKYKHIKEKHQ